MRNNNVYRNTAGTKKHDTIPASFRASWSHGQEGRSTLVQDLQIEIVTAMIMLIKKLQIEIVTAMIMVIKKLPWMRIHS